MESPLVLESDILFHCSSFFPKVALSDKNIS